MAVARADASDRRLYLQSGDPEALAQFDAQLAAQRQRERAGNPPGAPEPAPVNEAPPPAEEIVAPESHPASALAAAAPIALGAAAIDGPLPVGDVVGLVILGGAPFSRIVKNSIGSDNIVCAHSAAHCHLF